MITTELAVYPLVGLSIAGTFHVEREITPVILRELLLYQVRTDGHAEVVGLAGQVGAEVVVFVRFESRVPKVAPQNRGHPQVVGMSECLAYLHDLAARLVT